MQSSVFAPRPVPDQPVSLGENLPMNLILLGPGQVGGNLLEQLTRCSEALRSRSGIALKLAGVANSRQMRLFDSAGETLEQSTDLDALLDHGLGLNGPLLVVDCTASDSIPDRYASWLSQGVHLVTANKHGGSGCRQRYHAILRAAKDGRAEYRCEATVGAGLPVIQTLRELQESGDELLSVEGCLSGTLSWLFNEYDGSRPFSQRLRQARDLGYTEPDPRDDLSGMDVARKLLILAREAGHDLSMEQLSLESLVPLPLLEGDTNTFLTQCSAMDSFIEERWNLARESGGKLAYIGRFTAPGSATVSLEVLPPHHPCAQLQGSDNLVQLRTRHYSGNPLVLRGPGAGPTVTAAGVLRDIIAIARRCRRLS